MRDKEGQYSEHTIDESGYIPPYSVGRRSGNQNNPDAYKGDDYHFVKDDVMQLQIHNIRDTVTGVVSPTIVFYIPKNVVEILTSLVIQAS